MFKCVICGNYRDKELETGYYPRDRKHLKIVDCPNCGHRQLYPLLSQAELDEEYAEDKTVKAVLEEHNFDSDLTGMRTKFSEWTRIHADMYWDAMQECSKVINLGSGYGFLEEELISREGRKFEITGNEIGRVRLANWVGGDVCDINFALNGVPKEMQGKFDLVLGLHILEHMNEPVEYLKKIKDLLTDSGKIIIEVPNLNCFLCDISKEYSHFFYLYEHVSYFTEETLRLAFAKAGYKDIKTYTKEIYSVENHINWIRNGKPFTKYNQMYLPSEKIEFINEYYKEIVGKNGKGYSLICEASI